MNMDDGRGAQVMIYLIAGNAAQCLDFYQSAFGAEEITRWIDPGPGEQQGRVGHAQIRIGAQTLYVADDYDEMSKLGVKSPALLGGTSVNLWINVDDVEAVLSRALAAGARLLKPIHTSEHSNRRCRIADPAGHVWTLAQA